MKCFSPLNAVSGLVRKHCLSHSSSTRSTDGSKGTSSSTTPLLREACLHEASWPWTPLSSRTTSTCFELEYTSFDGYTADFDQCRYGAMCLDFDGLWRPVQKSTRMLTTKKSVLAALHLKCEHDHQHCPLEGAAPGYGPRTTYLEDYQPAFAATLAAAIAQPEPAQLWDAAYVVDVPEKKATGHLETPQESGSSYARGTCRPPSRSWSSTVSCVCSQGLQVRGLLETQETQSGCSIDNATTARF